MRFQRSVRLAAELLILSTATMTAQSPICFNGPIRAACSGFILFEGSAVLARGEAEHTATFTVPGSATGIGPITIVNRFHDLPGYYGGSLGYIHVVGERNAVGAVGELGFNEESDLGNAHRVALTVRARRQYPNATLDVGVGPLGVQVFVPRNGSCCTDRTIAHGATAEVAVMLRGYLGLTAGADFVNGGGRTATAVHAGVRVGSYGAVAAAILTAAAGVVGYWGLSHGD